MSPESSFDGREPRLGKDRDSDSRGSAWEIAVGDGRYVRILGRRHGPGPGRPEAVSAVVGWAPPVLNHAVRGESTEPGRLEVGSDKLNRAVRSGMARLFRMCHVRAACVTSGPRRTSL